MTVKETTATLAYLKNDKEKPVVVIMKQEIGFPERTKLAVFDLDNMQLLTEKEYTNNVSGPDSRICWPV